MEQIIEARIGKKAIGFSNGEASARASSDGEGGVMQFVEPEDLQRYGLIPEIVGRLPVTVHLDELDEEALVRILQEPKNALVKQYQKMFELEGIGLTFDPAAIRAIASKTLDRNTGARGLRSIIETTMRDIMFEIPSHSDVREVVITKECIEDSVPPLLLLHAEGQALEA
jgi:ATP-dependent Clp protease ATP-binding subunit ClpX